MADFKKAIKVILDHEGGFSNDPDDPGGATNHGVSLRLLSTMGEFGDFDGDGDVDVDDIRLLTIERASFIYQREWWNQFRYNMISDDDLATKILDWSINLGAVRTHKLIQRAINILPSTKSQLEVDGVLGSRTIMAINDADPKYLMVVMRGILAYYYIEIAEKNPINKKYIVGWLAKKAFDEKFPIN